MRIIAGDRKGLTLSTPPGMNTRPTSDRIKETLFNIIAFDIPDADFLDLFAGSGQMGIEALSRGARKADFVEHDRGALNCIRANIDKAGMTDRAGIHDMDVISFLKTYSGEPYSVIFIDPPYHKGLEEELLNALGQSSAVGLDTMIIMEADKKTILPDKLPGDLFITREKLYKTNKHIFMRKGIKT